MMQHQVDEMERSIRALHSNPEDIIEIRVLGPGKLTTAGFFESGHIHEAATLAAEFKARGLYIVLNRIHPGLLALSKNRFTERIEKTTSDGDVLWRLWLPLDFDPIKPKGISASDEEKAAAKQVAADCVKWLIGQGWPEPITADSGNGFHALFGIDLPNTNDAKALIKRVLESLAARFNNSAVKLDTVNSNAARIFKLYGSVAAKGDALPDRPHRVSSLMRVPDPIKPVSLAQLEAIAGEPNRSNGAGKSGSKHSPGNKNSSSDIEEALTFIDPDPRENWLHVGMALKSELGEAGRVIWDTWSEPSGKFNGPDQDTTWHGLKAEGGITIATLFKLALDGGWPGSKSNRNGGPHYQKEREAESLEPESVGTNGNANGHFQFLGYDRGTFWYFSTAARQPIPLDAKSHSNRESLFQLAPLGYWEINFPGRSRNSDWDVHAAAAHLIRTSYTKGIYNPNVIRARGAWSDSGKLLLHLGNRLLVDGQEVSIADYQPSGARRHYYEAGQAIDLALCDPLTIEQGTKLVDLAEQFLWTDPLSAKLLLGWIVVAPLSGTLEWRPHIWLTGPAGCGKGTVLAYFIKPLMPFRFPNDFTGETTEAGIRQSLKLDALPAIYDEAEVEDDPGRARIRRLLGTIRASSSATERVAKGTTTGKPQQFEMRSSFLLSSINTMTNRAADRRRIGVLELRKSDDPAQWDALKKKLEFVTADRGHALLARTIAHYPVLRQNIAVFGEQIGKHVGDPASGLQYGPLLAGAYLLEHDEPVEPVDAFETVQGYDWRNFGKPEPTERDERRCLDTILSMLLPVTVGQRTEKIPIGDLINVFNPDPDRISDLAIDRSDARKSLRDYGIKAEDGGVLVAHHSAELGKLLPKGPWQEWTQQLKRLKGAASSDKTAQLAGTSQRFTKLPWNLFD